jgi:transposase
MILWGNGMTRKIEEESLMDLYTRTCMTKWDHYTNREAARFVGVKLSTWKRWVRVFLRPVPSEGQGKGKARTLTRAQVGRVLVGGCLLRFFTAKEAKEILRANHFSRGKLQIGVVYLGLKLTLAVEVPGKW